MGKSGLTTHRRGAIWTERMLLGLILVSLGGTLNLLVAIHRRAAAEHRDAIAEAPAAVQAADPGPAGGPASPSSGPVESPAVAQKPEPPPAPPEEEDPTQKAIASLAAAKGKEIAAAEATDSRTTSMETAYRSAVAESQLWKRREMLVRQQIAGINAEAEKMERNADALDAERDVLERERDATKAALAKAGKRSGFAVLPYKGPNGTWRRPIVIECTHGGANLQPHGPTFTPLELSPRIHPRSSTFIKAIARELLHIQSADTPDGTPAVPYIVFLVRPDGIAPYYLARTCLEPLGIAFGYELVEQNLAINIPDFDDLTTWDGTTPLDVPLEPAPNTKSTNRRLAQANQPDDQMLARLAGLPPGDSGSMIGAIDGNGRGRGQGGQGMSASGSAEPQDFVWPGRGRRANQDGQRSAGASGAGESGSVAGLGNSGTPSADRGAGASKPEGGAGALGPLTGQDLARADQGALGGGPGKTETAKSGGSDEGGLGGLAVGSSGGRGFGDQAGGGSGGLAGDSGGSGGFGGQPGGLGSGTTVGVVNTEDVGTGAGAGADRASQPFPGSGAGMGGLATGGGALNTGGSGSGGGSGSADSIFQVPSFEPAGDQAGGSASLAQPGLLSGRGSSGGTGTGAGVQAPAFGLGQTIKGSSSSPGGDDGSAGIGGTLPQSGGGAMSAGGGRAGLNAAGSGPGSGLASGQPGGGNAGSGDSASGAGSGAPTTGSDPASGGAPNAKSTGTGGGGTGGLGGRGFDWSDAAKDGPPPGGSDVQGANPPQGSELTGTDAPPPSTAAAAAANVSAGGALNRSSPPANVQLDPANIPYQPRQISQDDIDRAKSLSGLSSLVSPDLAQKLSGVASALGTPSGMPSSSLPSDTTADSPSGGMASSTPSSNSSNNQNGGMPLGGNTQSSSLVSPASSMNSLGLNMSPSSKSDDANDMIAPPRRKDPLPTGAIESRFEIVVVCRKDDVVLQPGSYRLTGDVLRSAGQGSDFILAREIRAMVRNRAIVDPLIRPKPAIRFLVEQQGAETFAMARRQLLFSLPDWPVALQVAGSQDAGIFSRNSW